MAKCDVVISMNVRLELTLGEAVWLRGVLQNPLWGATPDSENEQDKTRRLAIFEELREVNELQVAAKQFAESMNKKPDRLKDHQREAL